LGQRIAKGFFLHGVLSLLKEKHFQQLGNSFSANSTFLFFGIISTVLVVEWYSGT
jgi:hypothetical protein